MKRSKLYEKLEDVLLSHYLELTPVHKDMYNRFYTYQVLENGEKKRFQWLIYSSFVSFYETLVTTKVSVKGYGELLLTRKIDFFQQKEIEKYIQDILESIESKFRVRW